MAIIRVNRNKGYTVMSNYHLKDKSISLKSKGLLSMMLSLPDEWSYSTRGLAAICKEGVDAIGAALKELEKGGYIIRNQIRGERSRIMETEYIIHERPQNESLSETSDSKKPITHSHHIRKVQTWKTPHNILLKNQVLKNQVKKD